MADTNPLDLPTPDEIAAGDTVEIRVTITDGDTDVEDDPKNLIGASVWAGILPPTTDEIIASSQTEAIDVSIDDSEGGPVIIRTTQEATQDLEGRHRFVLRIVDNAGGINTYIGSTAITDAPGDLGDVLITEDGSG